MGSLCTYQCLIWKGEGRSSEGRRFDKESRPVVGTFDHHQVPRMETFEFPLIVDTILGRPGYQSVTSCIIRGIGDQRWRPLFSQGSVSTFYTHVQDSS